MARCSGQLSWFWQSAVRASADMGARWCSTAPAKALSQAELEKLATLKSLMQRPAEKALKAAYLSTLSVAYRDAAVAAETYMAREASKTGDDVLYRSIPSLSERESTRDEEIVYPIIDVTQFSDAELPTSLQLDEKYMDKMTCWGQLLPSHIEMSHQLMTAVKLFPPTEATYPTHVDWDQALRCLSRHVSMKKVRLRRKFMAKQDVYHLNTWKPYKGHA